MSGGATICVNEIALVSRSVLQYKSRGRGFESYSGHFHSHKLSRLSFSKLQLAKIPSFSIVQAGVNRIDGLIFLIRVR